MGELEQTSFGRRHSHDRHRRTQFPEDNVNKYHSYEEQRPCPEGIDTTGAASCSVTETGQSTESNVHRKQEEENTDYQNRMDSSVKSCEETSLSHEQDCENNVTIPGAQEGQDVELMQEKKEENERLTNSETESVENMQHDRPYEEDIERQ